MHYIIDAFFTLVFIFTIGFLIKTKRKVVFKDTDYLDDNYFKAKIKKRNK